MSIRLDDKRNHDLTRPCLCICDESCSRQYHIYSITPGVRRKIHFCTVSVMLPGISLMPVNSIYRYPMLQPDSWYENHAGFLVLRGFSVSRQAYKSGED